MCCPIAPNGILTRPAGVVQRDASVVPVVSTIRFSARRHRDWVSHSMAALTGSVCGGYATGMRISLSTGTFYHRSVTYSLRVAHDAGCDGIELVLGLGYTLRGLEVIEQAVARQSLPVLSVHPPLRRLPGWPRAARERVGRVMEASRRLGAAVCVLHPGLYLDANGQRARLYAAALADAQRDAGASPRITIENNQTTGHRRAWVLDDLRALVRFAQDGGYGLTLDTCHLGANKDDLLATYDLVRPMLRNVHLSDMRWRGDRPQTHLVPGEGTLPLRAFLAHLAEDGYDGLLTLELHPRTVGLVGRAHAVRRVAQAVDFVRAAIGASSPASV
jgi:sugar phosphate isomerase/epimerase